LSQAGLSEFATVIDAPLVDTVIPHWSGLWYDIRSLAGKQIDLLTVDGPPEATGSLARYPAVPALMEMLADDAVVLVDDADRVDEQAATRLWTHRFPQLRGFAVENCEKGCSAFIVTKKHFESVPSTRADHLSIADSKS
jgi:hypothetical protein